jgi:hypothetical protein
VSLIRSVSSTCSRRSPRRCGTRWLAKVRKELKAAIPKQPRGRPPKAQAKETRRAQRQEQRVSDLFEHRHLFVQKKRTVAEGKTLQRITRGLPHLRVLRSIMDEVYRLFDRRCRTATALERLAQLRARVRRFQRVGRALAKLYSPTPVNLKGCST